MKRRKKLIAVIAVVVIGVGSLAVFQSDMKASLKKIFTSSSNDKKQITNDKKAEDNKNQKTDANAENNNTQKEASANTKEQDEKGYELTLASGVQVKVIYDEKDNNKKFKYVFPADNTLNYNISPSGKGIVISDTKTQSMTYVDIDGNKQDISYSQYTSSGGTTFKRENVTKENPAYIWSQSPKFLDEENIAYITQVPWFDNRTTKYIWKVNVKSKEFTHLQGIEGDDLKLNNLTDKGLEVVITDKTKYVKADGQITE
jgi:Sec-independent protein translocase protein TatA